MGIVQCHVSFQWCILAFGKTKDFFVSIKTDDLRELVVFLRKLGFQPKKSSWWFSSTTGKNWCLGALESGKSQDPRNPNHQDPNHRATWWHGWKWPFPSTFKLGGNGVPGNLPHSCKNTKRCWKNQHLDTFWPATGMHHGIKTWSVLMKPPDCPQKIVRCRHEVEETWGCFLRCFEKIKQIVPTHHHVALSMEVNENDANKKHPWSLNITYNQPTIIMKDFKLS